MDSFSVARNIWDFPMKRFVSNEPIFCQCMIYSLIISLTHKAIESVNRFNVNRWINAPKSLLFRKGNDTRSENVAFVIFVFHFRNLYRTETVRGNCLLAAMRWIIDETISYTIFQFSSHATLSTKLSKGKTFTCKCLLCEKGRDWN